MLRSFRRNALAVGLVALAVRAAAAQIDDLPEAVYPPLPKQAGSAEGFVPSGWKPEMRVSGDLNRDGIPDLVLVLREQNPKNVIKHDAMGKNPLDTNPRILAVAFGRASPAGYVLALENHTLIPRHEVPAWDDALDDKEGVTIERGTLRVKLGFFASAGSWQSSTTIYTFRYQNKRFELIGYDSEETLRNTGNTEETSINFLTGKMRIVTGNIQSDAKKTRWRTLPRRALYTIDRIGNGTEFNPRK